MDQRSEAELLENSGRENNQMELENRIRNLVWTVSGDYSLNLKPDLSRYHQMPNAVLYDTIRQGAFAKYFDRETFGMYLVKKVYSGARERELMTAAQLVTEQAVSERLERERPGVKNFRRRAWEEILDSDFAGLAGSAVGRLKIAYIRKKSAEESGKKDVLSGDIRRWMSHLDTAKNAADTMELIQLTDQLYNETTDPLFEKKHGSLKDILSVTYEELTEYSWKDFLSEDLYEDALQTYLERVTLEMTSFELEKTEKEEQTEASLVQKKVVIVDENALKRMYSYVECNFGRTYLSKTEEKSRNHQHCRGIHSDCSLYYTEGILKNPVVNNYQLSYAKKQKDKNIHAYYEDHRTVKQNVKTLSQMLKKALIQREDVHFSASDHGILTPSSLWKAGRCENAQLFRREIKNDALDFVVDILIDASGSQRVRQSSVALQAYILAETLSILKIPSRVMSFCTFWDYTILHRMRDYEDPREKNSGIFEYITSSNNRDGLAIRAIGADLLKREENKKLLIVLSDGKPYDVLVNRPNARNPQPYRDREAIYDTATEIRRLRLQGVQVLGVFTGKETELPAEHRIFGKDFAYIKDIKNFSHMVGSYLLKQMEE
ncbi:MAG: nitric oxide reductase activation protein [Fusicatenibacter sp.]|nr:nitric oxide reductase activation protein [Lachnospiraceae bacterium]MDY2938861.1 nitric oxide reductase activation protein [Fusicatenibacter sp.]